MDPDSGSGSDLTIVLLGHTGTGKSASGNTILGRAAFESKLSFKPVTTEICERSGKKFGKLIRVIDTPGILQNKETKDKVKTCCQLILQSSRPCLFLVVVSIARFSDEQEEAVRKTIEVLGDDSLKKSYMLFTSGDALDKSVQNFIFEDEVGSLPDIVRGLAGYHLFNNRDGGWEQVTELLRKSGHLQTSDLECHDYQVMRIVLLGPSERGITSSGNTILGSKKFKSDKTETVSESATVEGCQLKVVDTPGFSEKVLTLRKLYDKIIESKEKANPGPHAFVIVVRVDKISDTDIKLFELLLKLFGNEASKYSMVLFTHGDQLEGQSIDEMIQSNSYVSKLVSMCGGRYCVFDNTDKKNRRQVRNLTWTVDQMIADNRGQHCTSDMFRMAQTLIRNWEQTQADQAAGADEAPTLTAQSQLSPPSFWSKVCTACCCCPQDRSSGASDDEPLLQ